MFQDLRKALDTIEARNHKKSLEEFKAILDKEQIDYQRLPVIHITGTNGKGSTLNYCRALLSELGYTVGTFSSPYMIKHNDRICINGDMIDDDSFLKLINQCYPIIEAYDLSMFESDVVMMLVYFKQMKVDYAVIEVGIGGRNDKTNIVNGMINVITSIGYDHLKTLGPSLKDVALHKAGIIKEESHVVVSSLLQKELLHVIEEVVNQKHANIHIVEVPTTMNTYPYQFDADRYKNLTLQNVGSYQVNNFLLALQACLLIEPMIKREIIEKVMRTTFWPGRFEKIEDIYIDGAHNIDGVNALIQTIDSMQMEKVGIIFSALSDKDYHKMIELLLQMKYEVIVCPFEDSRALDRQDLEELNDVTCKNSFIEAYQWAKQQNYDLLVATGSLHFISNVRKQLLSDEDVRRDEHEE